MKGTSSDGTRLATLLAGELPTQSRVVLCTEAMNMRNVACVLILAGTLAGGCTDPIQAIDQSVDCNDICNRYKNCYDANYDTGACRSRCENYVHGDGGHGDQANQCDMCLDPRSCSTIPFSCSTQCAGIIP